jgi:hypothetical protein
VGMRLTIRFNEREELELKQLGTHLHEDNTAKIVKFAIATSINHIKFVTSAFISNEWECVFMKKRKTQELKRKVYD